MLLSSSHQVYCFSIHKFPLEFEVEAFHIGMKILLEFSLSVNLQHFVDCQIEINNIRIFVELMMTMNSESLPSKYVVRHLNLSPSIIESIRCALKPQRRSKESSPSDWIHLPFISSSSSSPHRLSWKGFSRDFLWIICEWLIYLSLAEVYYHRHWDL